MTHKLLLADDSATIQRVIELTFSGEDVDVLTVGDGEEAIARIPTERPDVILADIAMPKRSGYDVSAFVKGHPDLKHIPVLLLAGAFEPVDEARAEEVACDGVLVKPFEPQQVIARVRELLETPVAGVRPSGSSPLRPVERPAMHAPPRPLEFPKREEPRSLPAAAPPEPARAPAVDRGADDEVDHTALMPEPSADLEGPSPPSSWGTESGESLTDYFDRLDAAFSNLDTGASPSPLPDNIEDDTLEVPTLDELLAPPPERPFAPSIDPSLHPPSGVQPLPPPAAAPVEPPDVTPTRAPGPALMPRPSSSASVLAEAFSALLALEEGEPGAKPVRLASVGQEPAVTEAMVDQIARRVVERLAPDAVREIVAQVVSEIAERLVREEIERVRHRP